MQKMVNVDGITKENIKQYHPNWPQILGHPFRVWMVGGSGSGRTNSLFNLITHQPEINKIYSCAKDWCKRKYQLLIKQWKKCKLKEFKWF